MNSAADSNRKLVLSLYRILLGHLKNYDSVPALRGSLWANEIVKERMGIRFYMGQGRCRDHLKQAFLASSTLKEEDSVSKSINEGYKLVQYLSHHALGNLSEVYPSTGFPNSVSQTLGKFPYGPIEFLDSGSGSKSVVNWGSMRDDSEIDSEEEDRIQDEDSEDEDDDSDEDDDFPYNSSLKVQKLTDLDRMMLTEASLEFSQRELDPPPIHVEADLTESGIRNLSNEDLRQILKDRLKIEDEIEYIFCIRIMNRLVSTGETLQLGSGKLYRSFIDLCLNEDDVIAALTVVGEMMKDDKIRAPSRSDEVLVSIMNHSIRHPGMPGLLATLRLSSWNDTIAPEGACLKPHRKSSYELFSLFILGCCVNRNPELAIESIRQIFLKRSETKLEQLGMTCFSSILYHMLLKNGSSKENFDNIIELISLYNGLNRQDLVLTLLRFSSMEAHVPQKIHLMQTIRKFMHHIQIKPTPEFKEAWKSQFEKKAFTQISSHLSQLNLHPEFDSENQLA